MQKKCVPVKAEHECEICEVQDMGGCALKHNTTDSVRVLPASIELLQGAKWAEMGGQSGVDIA